MKRMVKQALVLIFVLGSLQSQMVIAKKCNDLILIFDPNFSEGVGGQGGAMTFRLVDALQAKAAPIILSSNVLGNFCFWKTQYKQMLDAVKQEALKTKSIDAAKQKSLDLLKSTTLYDPKGIDSVLISGTDLSGNDWDCYSHRQADLILLVPKNYSARGFNVASLDKIANVSPESVLNHIQSKSVKSSINIVEAVKSMIIAEKSSNETKSASWNIYVTGHGGPAHKKKIFIERLEKSQQSLANFQRFAESDRKSGKLESEKEMLKHAESMEKNIEKQQLFLQSIQNLSDEAVVPQTAYVAGINFDDFASLMRFFDSSIETSFVYYATCFGGGYNQTFLNDSLGKLKANFIVVAEGSSESVTYGTDAPSLKLNERGTELVLSNMRFINFFGLLENFFGEPTKVVGMEAPQGWQKDPIAAIVGVVTELSIPENQPSVRIPAVGVFTALKVDKKVKILTNTVVKAYELEGRIIDLTNSEIQTLIVYPAYIGVPIKMANQDIISPTPQKIEQLYKTTHIFEEIITDNPLYLDIPHFVFLNSSYSKITFVIKKLTSLNYEKSGLKRTVQLLSDKGKEILPIENMIIQIAGRMSSSDMIDVDVNVVFMLDGQTYSQSHHIKDLASIAYAIKNLAGSEYAGARETVDLFKSVPWILLFFSSELSSLADKIVGPQEVAKLKERSVPAMVEYFDNMIDKTFGVQRVGALKKILLLKKLESLERATTPEALQAQKELLEKNKKPAADIVVSLDRHKKELTQLKDDLEKLTAKEMSQRERDIALNKIKNVEARIIKELGL